MKCMRIGMILLFSLSLFPRSFSNASATNNNMVSDKTDKWVALLQEAMVSAESFFVKVHAAEALIENNYPAGIEPVFMHLQKAAPAYFIGASRVLAKLNRKNPEKEQPYLDGILAIFLHSDIYLQRLIALESLGKLGYYKPLPELKQQAESGEKRLKSMARWVMANSGNVADENKLADLFTSEEPFDNRDAAYAFRFRQNMQPENYILLQTCANRLAKDNPHRVYVVSAAYVHALNKEQEKKAYQELIAYLAGQNNERYEVAEALGSRGLKKEMEVLEKLLQDPDLDVRVAAVNALLKIRNRK